MNGDRADKVAIRAQKQSAGAIGVQLLAIAFLSGGGLAVGAAPARNLLVNPGFELAEQGFPTQWGFFEANAKSMFCLDGEHAVEGRYSLRADGKVEETWVPLFSKDPVRVSPGEEFTLGAYVRPEISAGTILFALREIGEDGRSVRFDHVPVPQNADWVFCAQKMTMSAQTAAIQVFIVMQKCVGRAWFDDLRLVRGGLQDPGPKPDIGRPAPSAQHQMVANRNLLGNGGLEPDKAGGVPHGWRFEAGTDSHRGTLDAATRFAGSASFRMDHAEGGLPGSALATAAAVPILPNRDYVLSGWVRTAPDGRSRWTTVPSARGRRVEGAVLQLVFKDDSRKAVTEFWSPATQTGGAWQRTLVSGRAPGNATSADVRLFLGDFKGAAWFDAVRLESVDEAAAVGGAWRLPVDTYDAGALPPIFRVVPETGTLGASLTADDGGNEWSILLKAGDRARGELCFPPIDTSFPGTFMVSGEVRWAEGGNGTPPKLVFRSLDADGATIAQREVPLTGHDAQRSSLSEMVVPDPNAAHLAVAVVLEGGQCELELRHWRAQRLSRTSLAEYAGLPATSAPVTNAPSAATPRGKAGARFPDVRLGMAGGAPTVLVNGKPVYFNQYWHQSIPPDAIARNCRRAGLIHVLSVAKIDWSTDPPTLNCQEEVDRQIRQVLKTDPDARIILDPDTSTEQGPVSWAFHHPAERYVSDAGGTAVRDYGGSTKTFPSFASAAWRHDVDTMLAGLVKHVKQADYAPHVIGYLLSGYEWFHWEWSSPQARVDVSTHMRDEFRHWLKAKYVTPAALATAWGESTADFASVEVPSSEARRRTCDGVFRDPAADRPVIDFSRFYSEVVADVLIRQGRTIKAAAGQNTLVFSFYGYLPHFFDSQARKSSGHFAIRKLLDSGVVDMTAAPSDGYLFERASGGAGAFMTIPGAYTVRGTLFVDQPDYRTHWAAQDIERTNTLRDDIQLFRRNFAMTLTNLAAIQYLDFSKFYTLGDRRIVNELSRYAQIEALARQADRTPDGEGFAVIYSEDCADTIGTDRVLLGGGVTYHQRPLFSRAGMPHRWYLLSDLANPRLPDYRLYVFPNAFKLTVAEQALIRRKCMKKGNVLLFVYAPGYTDAKTCSAANISAFLDMTVARCDGGRRAEATVAAAGATMPWLQDAPGMAFGPGVDWPLMFRVEPTADVHVLGRYTTDRTPALAWRNAAGCTVVYSAVPLLPPDLLRDLGRLAGCNLYLGTSDALYADRNFVSIHSKAPGTKCIRLPRHAAEVYDLIRRTSLGRNTDRFTVHMEAHETAIFYVGAAPFAAGRPGAALTPVPAKRRWWPW